MHYLTGNTQEEIAAGEDAASESIKYAYGSNLTKFIPINDEAEIAGLLASGKRIFTPRTDNLNAVRLGHAERAQGRPQPNLLAIEDNVTSTTYSVEQLQDTLNIYPIVDDGSFKIVLEVIRQSNKDKCEDKEKNKPLMNLRSLIEQAMKPLRPSFAAYSF